ncbi:MAG: type II toxin-antitoxin system prevent-host-death family antitoxin [Elusimicrobiota bacterium]
MKNNKKKLLYQSEKQGHVWQLQLAKARFSELFRLVRSEGPQRITKQGKEAVVLISSEYFDLLTHRESQKKDLTEFFGTSPLTEISLERTKDLGRKIDL